MYTEENEKNTRHPMYSGRWWITQIEEAEKELENKWWPRCETVLNRYVDERNDNGEDQSKYNMFWANTQILKAALYATPPKPTVTRENADSKDDAARVAALMLERMLQQGMTKSKSDSHEAVKAAVEDRLLPGLGQVWVRYESEIEEYEMPPMFPGMSPIKGERVKSEKVCTDYVNWRDFLWSPARRWDDVWWVARRVWMKKNAFRKRFGEKANGLWEQIASGADEAKTSTIPKGFKKNRAEVFEVWCEATAKVYFVCRGLDDCVDRIADPLGLEEFFPCPKPLLATHTNESLIPVPDYCMVQDQYNELDTLNNRISALTKALRVVGAYDSNNAELKGMISGNELAMIPVENWAALGEQGGMARAVEWFPVEVIAKVLSELTVQRSQVVSQIYELTSISDIMRGASNPRETAKAQQLKAQYSSVRLQLTQQDVAVFVQDVLRIKAEVISRHFQPESIKKQSQIEQTDSAEFADQAIALLKDFDASTYRIEVSEESLSMADYTAERQMRIELITAVGQFLSQSAQMVQEQPGALPYMLKIVQWVVASFRGSRDIETVLDQAIQAAAATPPPGKDDGKAAAEQAKAQAEAQIAQQKLQFEQQLAQQKAQADMQMAQMQAGLDGQIAKMQAQMDAQLQVMLAKIKADTDIEIAEMNNDTKLAIAEGQQETQEEIAKNQPKKD